MTDLSCLPENTGLFFNGGFQNGDGLLTSTNPATGEMLMEVSCASAEIVNRAIMISADGKVISRYDKIHLFDVSFEGFP